MSKLKIAIAGAAFIGLGALLVVQYQQISALKQQVQAQKSDSIAVQEQLARNDSNVRELERLRKDHDDLLRLRGEVGTLRRRLGEPDKPVITRPATNVVAAAPANEDPAVTAFKAQTQARINGAKSLVLAFRVFSNDNEDFLPKSFEEMAPYLSDKMKKFVHYEQYETLYQGKFTDFKTPANTILVREITPVQSPTGEWTRTYGFVDGHAEVHSQPTEDFSQWEQSRLPGANLN
jgi:hypothetical protein